MMNLEPYEAMAKLCLTERERRDIAGRIDMLIQSFGELADVDTGNIEPMATVLDIRNIFREDVAEKNILREEILANAPERYDGYFQVPRTLD